jgi:hypothetical protein
MQRSKNPSQKTKVKTSPRRVSAALVSSNTAKPKRLLRGSEEIEISDTKYELSLAEFPLFILSTRLPKGVKAINYSDTINVDGKQIPRHWRVTWNEEHGKPGQSAAATFFALYQIWKDDNFQSEWIHFDTIAALLKRKGIVRNQQTHKRIIRDLKCLQNLYIEAKNAFYDAKEKKYVDRSFHLFEELIIKKDTPGSPDENSKGYIKAHPFLHRAAQNTSFLVGIPERQFFALPSLQQRLFLHLRKMLSVYNQYTRKIDDLAAQLPIFATSRKAKFMIKQAANGLINANIIPLFDKVSCLKNNVIRFEKSSAEQLNLFGEIPVATEEQAERQKIIADGNYQMILEHCRDEHSFPFYRLIASRMDTDDIHRALSETKDYCRRAGTGFAPKLFTKIIIKIAQQRGIMITGLVDDE